MNTSASTRDRITAFLERLGKALSGGDVKAIPSFWGVPSLVLTDQGVVTVSDEAQIEKFFSEAVAAYRSQGLVSTKPELEDLKILSDRLVAADVRWPAFDQAGIEKSSERSHYILAIEDNGEPKIRVALTTTAES